MRPVTHLLIFVSLLSLTVAIRLVGRGYYSHDLEKVVGAVSQRRALEIQAGWKARLYEKLSSEGTQATILDKIRRQELSLSDLQKAKLETRVRELLRYLAQPSFEDYYRLKTAGIHYQFAPEGLASNVLAKACQQNKLRPSADTKESVRFLWDRVHDRAGKTIASSITAVALDSVAATVSHTNSGKTLLTGTAKEGFTVA